MRYVHAFEPRAVAERWVYAVPESVNLGDLLTRVRGIELGDSQQLAIAIAIRGPKNVVKVAVDAGEQAIGMGFEEPEGVNGGAVVIHVDRHKGGRRWLGLEERR
jgi:hypothetical protein